MDLVDGVDKQLMKDFAAMRNHEVEPDTPDWPNLLSFMKWRRTFNNGMRMEWLRYCHTLHKLKNCKIGMTSTLT